MRSYMLAPRRSPWALSGLVTCADCGRSMTAYGRSDGKQRVQCSGRTQGHGCDAPTFFAHLVEDQLGAFLGQHFAVPAAEREHLVRAWHLGQDRTTDAAAERERLHRKLERLKVLFLEGDLDQAAYRAQKGDLQSQLAALPAERGNGEGVGRRLADYLNNVALAWQAATPEERNRLARELFGEVVVDNKTAVAVMPRPDLFPLFAAVACQLDADVTYGRKRRGSTQHLQNLFAGLVRVPVPDFRPLPACTPRRSTGARRDAPAPSRYRQRARRLTPVQEASIQSLAATKSLRSLAVEFGVSHETVRAIVRR